MKIVINASSELLSDTTDGTYWVEEYVDNLIVAVEEWCSRFLVNADVIVDGNFANWQGGKHSQLADYMIGGNRIAVYCPSKETINEGLTLMIDRIETASKFKGDAYEGRFDLETNGGAA
tara:strand:- start:148 stop:504 length:357 start_codon:yes stop_codon:yes gene_type:complete